MQMEIVQDTGLLPLQRRGRELWLAVSGASVRVLDGKGERLAWFGTPGKKIVGLVAQRDADTVAMAGGNEVNWWNWRAEQVVRRHEFEADISTIKVMSSGSIAVGSWEGDVLMMSAMGDEIWKRKLDGGIIELEVMSSGSIAVGSSAGDEMEASTRLRHTLY
jgi:outer membrane protein assembly factor BamB